MSHILRNIIRITAVLIFIAGFPAAFLMVSSGSVDRHVIFGILLGFALLGLFVWFLPTKKPTAERIVCAIIFAGGLLSGFLIGYRIGASPAPPWSWDKGGYMQVVVGPYIDWPAAIIPWMIFIILGFTMLFASSARSATQQMESRI